MEHRPLANGKWSFGLGTWGPYANLTAVALICLMFYQGTRDMQQQAREDRQMFREELRALHADNQHQQKAIHELALAVRDMTAEVKRLREERPPQP